MPQLLENLLIRSLARVADRSADRGAATEPNDSNRSVEPVAATDLVEMGRMHFGPKDRQFLDSECEVADRHTDAQNTRRYFRRGVVKIHQGIRHDGSVSFGAKAPI